MTRPKVEPDKRQRTACACDSCKRRKQKCDGKLPCNTCIKRQLPCSYKNANQEGGHQSAAADDGLESPVAKRRQVDTTTPKTLGSSPDDTNVVDDLPQSHSHLQPLTQWNPSDVPAISMEQLPDSSKASSGPARHFDSDSKSRMSNASGNAEEAEVMSSQRMLQDSTGRLLYVGDSATLSYLQLIRMMVENIAGISEFTSDPRRHMIMEATIVLPPFAAATSQLPDPRTADILVTSFFVNTSGFLEIFDRRSFQDSIQEAYNNPLAINHSLLCLLFLVLAIGLVLAQPEPGSEDEAIINKLRSDKFNRAAIFFMKAKDLADPVSGFEDADFWSVQALLLMSLYMLSVSKRNTSYAYFGMAVRSAFALGLHREESMEVFSEVERRVRRNVWRSLFVLDRFLAASLGRPTAISEDDCSDHALDPPGFPGPRSPEAPEALSHDAGPTTTAALDAAVGVCRIVGITLKKVYSKRKISTSVAQEIALQLERWYDRLPPVLRWQELMARGTVPIHGIAVLHLNLLHCHSVILLTRPFFLYLLSKAYYRTPGANSKPSDGHHHGGAETRSSSSSNVGRKSSPRLSHKMEHFAQTCVEASQHTLVLAQAAYDAQYLPQCNPFVIHFVFAAGLVILSNEFAKLYHNPDAESAIASCSRILKFCGERDAQADRVSWIVDKFHEANKAQSARHRDMCLPGRTPPVMKSFSQTFPFDRIYDPMAHFFTRDKSNSNGGGGGGRIAQPQQQQQHAAAPGLPLSLSGGHPKHSVISSTGMPPQSILPSGIQQASSDGSGASPIQSGSGPGVVVTAAGAAVHDMDAMMGGAAPEDEIPFDSYWPQSPWQNTSGIPLSHPHHPVEYGGGEAYGMAGGQHQHQHHPHHPGIPLNNVLSSGHVPLYPATDYR